MNCLHSLLPGRLNNDETVIFSGTCNTMLFRQSIFLFLPFGFIFLTLIFILFGIKKSSGQQLEEISHQKPLQISGDLNLNFEYYHSNENGTELKPLNGYLTGNVTISIFGISFPFSMTASDQKKTSFTQPLYQYGISPSYKWATIHAGYSNVCFSGYTLDGVPFLGGGVELNPNRFRFSFIKGRFQKAVRDTGSLYSVIPAYERWGYGVKAGWGSEKAYFDLIGFSAKDRVKSLPSLPENFAVSPQENVSVGIKSAVNLEKMDIRVDAAISALTGDVTDKEAKIKDDRWAFLKKFLNSNGTTISRLAVEASGGYTDSKWGIRASYKRIEPDFGSLGAYYLQSDIQQFYLSPSLRLLKKNLRINASFGFQHDDLLHAKNYSTKKAITTFSVNYDYNPLISGGATFSNYGTSQESGKLQLNDSIRLSLVSLSYGGYINLNKFEASRSWKLSFSITKNDFLDNNIVTKLFTQTRALLSIISFSYSFFPKHLFFNSSLSANYFRSARDTTRYLGLRTGINYTLFKNKLSTSVNSTLNFKKTTGAPGERILYFNGSLVYAVQSRYSLGLTIILSKNTGSISNSIYSINEQQINLSYNYTF